MISRKFSLYTLFSFTLSVFVLMRASEVRSQSFSSIIDFPVEKFTFQGAPLVNQNGDTIRINLDVFYHIPANPKAIVYFFHGTGGGARVWFLRVEQPLLLRDAVSRGFGIVSMESSNRNEGVWVVSVDSTGNQVPWTDNVDTENVWHVHSDFMITNNKYDENTPLFAIGFSNGAGFTGSMTLRASTFFYSNQDTIQDVSNVVPFRAVTMYGAVGRRSRDLNYDIPTLFNVGINDNVVPAFPNMTDHPDWPYSPDVCVEYSYDQLVARGIDTEFNVKPEEPLQPDRFERIPGIDSVGSVMIYESLKAARGPNGEMILGENDSLLVNPKDFDFLPFIPAQYHNFSGEINQQFVTIYAEHGVMSDFKDNTLSFFEKYITATSVEASESRSIPERYSLAQNFPNPFNPETTIRYQLGSASPVKLRIFNLLGRHVATLVDTEQSEGAHEASWTAKDDSGKQVASGVYLYKLETSDFVQTKKLILIR